MFIFYLHITLRNFFSENQTFNYNKTGVIFLSRKKMLNLKKISKYLLLSNYVIRFIYFKLYVKHNGLFHLI